MCKKKKIVTEQWLPQDFLESLITDVGGTLAHHSDAVLGDLRQRLR